MTEEPLPNADHVAARNQKPELSRRACLKGALGIAATTVGAIGWQSSGAVAQTAAPAQAMAPTPKFAYVGCRTTKERNARGEGINVHRVDPASGTWTHVQLLKDIVNPSFLTFDSKQRFLFCVHGDFGEVSAFGIDGTTGRLTFLNQQSCGGKNPVHLTVDPTDRFLMVANYATGSLATLPIGPDGKLGALVDLVQLTGDTGPHRVEQVSSHPHHIPYDRDRGFLVVPDKALDRIFVFKLDAGQGKLVPNDPPSVAARSGSGPRHIAFQPPGSHAAGSHAYVINELDSTVTTYAYDGAKGTLQPKQILPAVPADHTGENRAAGIVVSPNGRFLYATNRGHNSVAIFAIDPSTGQLSPVGWEPSQGKMPRFLTLDPTGNFLYVANEATDTIVGFRIDDATGKLSSIGTVAQTGSPVCIVFSTV